MRATTFHRATKLSVGPPADCLVADVPLGCRICELAEQYLILHKLFSWHLRLDPPGENGARWRRCGRSRAEELAKAQYAAARDPAACALLYAALGKKSLLQGARVHPCA